MPMGVGKHEAEVLNEALLMAMEHIRTSDRTIKQILGLTDSLKFRSSMTLFAQATKENNVFENALQKSYEGQHDQLTLERL